MPGIDRRSFLQGTGMLAAGALTSNLRAYASAPAAVGQEANQDGGVLAPPVFEPFEWTAPGLAFSFEFLDKRIRSRTLLPPGITPPRDIPAPTADRKSTRLNSSH